jgi:hypothetical protein
VLSVIRSLDSVRLAVETSRWRAEARGDALTILDDLGEAISELTDVVEALHNELAVLRAVVRDQRGA